MLGVQSPSSPGIGVGVGGSPAAGGPAPPNPNLLLWSEELDRAATWAATGVVVTANATNDPNGQLTADLLTFAAGGTLRQVTPAPATTGAAVTAVIASTTERPSISGDFDGVTYKFSFYSMLGDGVNLRLRLDRSGGFLRVSFEDVGDEAIVNIAWCKLETPDLTAYVKREGT